MSSLDCKSDKTICTRSQNWTFNSPQQITWPKGYFGADNIPLQIILIIRTSTTDPSYLCTDQSNFFYTSEVIFNTGSATIQIPSLFQSSSSSTGNNGNNSINGNNWRTSNLPSINENTKFKIRVTNIEKTQCFEDPWLSISLISDATVDNNKPFPRNTTEAPPPSNPSPNNSNNNNNNNTSSGNGTENSNNANSIGSNNNNEVSTNKNSMIIGIVLGSLFALLVVASFVMFVRRRHRRRHHGQQKEQDSQKALKDETQEDQNDKNRKKGTIGIASQQILTKFSGEEVQHHDDEVNLDDIVVNYDDQDSIEYGDEEEVQFDLTKEYTFPTPFLPSLMEHPLPTIYEEEFKMDNNDGQATIKPLSNSNKNLFIRSHIPENLETYS